MQMYKYNGKYINGKYTMKRTSNFPGKYVQYIFNTQYVRYIFDTHQSIQGISKRDLTFDTDTYTYTYTYIYIYTYTNTYTYMLSCKIHRHRLIIDTINERCTWNPYLGTVSRCAAVCCSVLPSVAVCCIVLHCVTMCCSELQCVAVCCCVYPLKPM